MSVGKGTARREKKSDVIRRKVWWTKISEMIITKNNWKKLKSEHICNKNKTKRNNLDGVVIYGENQTKQKW